MKINNFERSSKSLFIFFGLLGILLFSQCQKDKMLSIEKILARVEVCKNNPLTDSLTIATNLIGTWKLIGAECNYCGSNEKPEITLKFIEKTGNISFLNAQDEIDTTTFDWQIVPMSSPNQLEQFQIQTEPFNSALQISGFCNKYLFIDYDRNAIDDGVTYLYEKQ